MNDNRNYKYSPDSASKRKEYPIICNWVPSGSRVIDLGCGDGSLLAMLKNKGVDGEGIDIVKSAVRATQRKDIKAKQGRIDRRLDYKDRSFDFAICNVTLQMVMYPEILLSEMKRIAQKQIISFPNFAFLPNRLDLLLNGRMPRQMMPGYSWYSTGHIHQLSIRDFEEFCQMHKIKILDQHHIFPEKLFFIPKKVLKQFPNVFASTAIFLTTKRKK
jgi:methionine biosynthesis protein MetW